MVAASDLTKSKKEYKHTPTALWAADQAGGKEGIDPLNKGEKRLKDGEVPYRPTDKEISDAVMHGISRQPTDQEMFGKFVVTEEMAKKAQDDWENKANKAFDEMKAPIVSKEEPTPEWGEGESFNKSLSRKELEERNMFTDE